MCILGLCYPAQGSPFLECVDACPPTRAAWKARDESEPVRAPIGFDPDDSWRDAREARVEREHETHDAAVREGR